MQEVEVKGISWIQINKIIIIHKLKHVKCKRDFKTHAYVNLRMWYPKML